MKKDLLSLIALAAMSALASAAETQAQSPSAAPAPNQYRVASPDGKIQAQVSAGTNFSYSVVFDGELLIVPSRLGLGFGDELQLGQDVQVVDAGTSEWICGHNRTGTEPVK